MKPTRRLQQEPKANKIVCRLPAVVTDPHDGVMVEAASCSTEARKSCSPPQKTRATCRVTTRNGTGLNPLISPGANWAKSVENDPSGTCALRSANMSPNGVGHVTVRCGLAAERIEISHRGYVLLADRRPPEGLRNRNVATKCAPNRLD
jgi:hypothetical protein